MKNQEYLMHWGIKKGSQRKNHKYIKREWRNGKWVYYYNNTKGSRKDLKAISKIADWAGADEKTNYEHAKEKYLRDTGNSDNISVANLRTEMLKYNRDRANERSEKRLYDLITKAYIPSDYSKQVADDKKVVEAFNKAYIAKNDYELVKKQYDKTLIGFSENTINKGKSLLNRLMKKG